MRHRETTRDETYSVHMEQRKRSSCSANFGSWSVDNTTTAGLTYSKSIDDIEVPAFHHLRKCGKFLPLNPVDIVTTTTQRVPMVWETRSRPSSCANWTLERRGEEWNNFPEAPAVSVPPAVITAVVNGAVADSRSAAWDVLTDMAEGRETLRLFQAAIRDVRRFAFMTIADAQRSLRTTKHKHSVTKLRELISQRWLEYRYGWMPVVYSLQSAVQALAKEREEWERGRARQNIVDTTTHYSEATSHGVRRQATSTREVSIAVRGWAASEIRWQNSYGFDPLVTSYELLTLSFVLDWFIQVGTYLEAISPFAAGKTIGSCASIRMSEIVTTTATRTTLQNQAGVTWETVTTRPSLTITTRESYSRFAASPSLPGFNPRINWKRTFDAIALAGGLNRDVLRRIRI